MTGWDQEAARVLVEGYEARDWLTSTQRTELDTLIGNGMEDIALTILAEIPPE